MKQAEIARLFIKTFSSFLNHLEKEISDYTYTFNEVKIILDVLDQGVTTAKEIEDNLGLDKGYTSRLIKNLVEQNILAREQISEDKRSYSLSLTQRGEEVGKELLREYIVLLEKHLARISTAQQKELAEHMLAILKLTQIL